MGLPWVRLDSNIGSHDKILALLSDSSPKRWQAAFSYTASIGWSGGHETDGRIPSAALPFVHGTKDTARLLVIYHLWTESLTGWQIVNYTKRQESSDVSEAIRAAQSLGGKKAQCRKNHGPDCGCWQKGAK